jgi:gliding motility-associated-like protein
VSSLTNSTAQLVVDTNHTAIELVDSILIGNGISAANITYSGPTVSIGGFSGGNTTNIGIDNGILITTGSVYNAIGPNNVGDATTNTLGGSDPQLASLASGTVYDASVLEFDFVPLSDTIELEYVFASEEYAEWVGQNFNDVFGFFITGSNPSGGTYNNQNIALIPGTNLPVTINNINNGFLNNGINPSNAAYYINNTGGTTIQYDGFTTPLTTTLLVTPCSSYHIKIAIGDVGDHTFDSGIFLKSESFSANIVTVDATYSNSQLANGCVEGCSDAYVHFKLEHPTTYDRTIHYTIGGTAINGVDYLQIPDSVIIPANSDSVMVLVSPISDGLSEGVESIQLIVQTSACFTDTLDILINDYDSIGVSINSPATVCVGDSISISAITTNGIGPNSFLWNTTDTISIIEKKMITSTTYSVLVTDFCGFTDTASVTISPDTLPLISVTPIAVSICKGVSTKLKVTGANTYQWSPSSSLSASTGDSVMASPAMTTQYTVIGSNSFGCKDTATTTVTVLALPTVAASSVLSDICIGETTTLNATGANTYVWSPASTLNQNTGATVNATPIATTTYWVVGTGQNLCKDSVDVTITVHNQPNVQITPNNPELCLGQTKALTAYGAQNYSWSPATYLNTNTGSSVISSATNNISYIVTGVDTWGCENKDTVSLTVHTLPTVNVVPDDTVICKNTSIPITASGTLNYTWTPSAGLSATTGNIVTASPLITTTYIVTGTDIHGCSDTASANIKVSPAPVPTPQNQSICIGDTATLSVSSTIAGTAFIWSTGSTANTITVNPVVTSSYSVIATTPAGCVDSALATVTVNPLPVVVANPNASAICPGSSVNIIASGASSYVWSPSNTLSSSTGSSVFASPTATTTYTIVGTSGAGCVDSTTVTIQLNVGVTVNIDHHDTLVCIGSTFPLTASGALNYTWTPSTFLNANNTASVMVTPTSDITYIVVGTDTNGCTGMDTANIEVSPILSTSASPPQICQGDSTLVSAIVSQTVTYLWSTNDTTSSFYVSPPATTSYSVTVTDTMGCTATDSVTVIVDSIPPISVSPLNPNLCDGYPINLTASGGVTYVWSPTSTLSSSTGTTVTATPNTNITYTVVGTDINGCKDSAKTTITIIPSPTVTVTPSYDTICQGLSTNLTAAGAISYTWSPVSGLSSAAGSIVVATPITSTNYKVVGTATNGCEGSAWAHIKVNPKPIVSVTPDTIAICSGDSTHLQASGASTYIWSPSVSLSSATLASVYAKPLASTTYTLIGSTTFGCLDTTSAYVQIHNKPNLTLNPIDPHMCPQDSITFIVSGANQYIWSPSIGLNSTTNDTVIAKPTQSTLYQVIGSTGFGCTDTVTSNIEVSPIPVISPSNPTICTNDTLMLVVTSNTSSSTFLWNTGQTNDTIWVSPNTNTTYSVIATDSSNCTNVDSVLVIVDAIANLAISPIDPSVCLGDTVAITASGATSYSWSPSANLTSSTGTTIGAFPTINTAYKLIGTTPTGCQDSLKFSIQVLSLPTISVTPDTASICEGSSQTIIATGANTYVWSPAAGLNQTNDDTVIATPSSSIVYQVIGYDAQGCRDTVTSSLIVFTDPVLTPTSPSTCPGDTVNVTVSTPVTPQSYLWSTGATTDSIQVSPLVTTSYSLTIVYSGGCTKTDSMIVNVYTDSTVLGVAQDYSICPGDTAHLIGSRVSSYAWSPNIDLLQTTGSNVGATPDTSIVYTVHGTSVHGCKTTDTVSIHVFPFPHVNAVATPDTICSSDSSLLIGSGAQSYLWLPNNGIINNGLAQVYAAPDSTIQYTVTGIDANGCIDKDTILLTVDQGPTTTIMPLAPIICEGDTVALTAYGADTYVWTPNTSISGATNQTAYVYPTADIYYYVRGYNANGCYDDTNVYVTVKRNPVLWVSPVLDSICEGDSIQITVLGAGGNGTYVWNPSSSLNMLSSGVAMATPITTTNYQITGISTAGCSKTISSVIKVFPKPIMTISSNPLNICQNDSAVITSTGADFYNWQSNSSIFSNWGDSIGVQPISTTTYKVVGSTIHGCSDSTTHLLIVHNLPNVSVSASDSTICLGDSTQLTASAAQSYIWNANPFLNQLTGAVVTAIPTNNSSFIVEGTDLFGCVNRDTVDIQVQAIPVVTAQAAPGVICEGSQVALTAQSNISGVSFNWNNGAVGSPVYDTPLSSTSYQVNGSTSFGCYDSAIVSVQVNPIPQLSMNVPDTTICDYDSIILSVNSSVSPANYLWNTSSTNSSILVHPVSLSTYTVVVSDSIGCTDSINVAVGVQPTPFVSVSTSNSPTCGGDTVLISCATSGAVNNYQWSNGMTTSNISVSPLASTYYSLLVTDSIGCQNTDSVFQQVNPAPIVSITSSVGQICVGDIVSFSAISNVNPINLLWNTGATSSSISMSPTVSTYYSIIATDSVGCSGYDTSSVIVHNLPVITFNPAIAGLCIGNNITIAANSSPAANSYLWSNNSSNQSITIAPNSTTSYSVTVTDIHNCIDSAVQQVSVYPLPIVNISPASSTICDGDTVSLLVSSNHPIQSVLWSTNQTTTSIGVNPSSSSTYWAEVVDTNSCVNSDTASVQVLPRPSCSITALPDTICSVDSTLVTYSGTGSATALYNWDFDGATVISGSGNNPHWLKWNNAGLHGVTLDVTENGCTSYPDTAIIMVNLTPTVIFETLPADACIGEVINFTNKTQNIKEFYWDFGNLSSNTDTSILENPTYIYNNAGLYTVSLDVLSNEGCPASGQFKYVDVHKNPIANFTANPMRVDIIDSRVDFTDVSLGAISWDYDFGEPNSGSNNTSNVQNPYHVYIDTGVFIIRLSVENTFGCTDTAYNSISVYASGQLYYPNAFTPNNDGLNDVYFVKGRYFDWATFEMYVYNRWGEIVFQSNDVNKAWNGKYNNTGQDCPVDVYSLIIRVRGGDGKMRRYNGSITLVR